MSELQQPPKAGQDAQESKPRWFVEPRSTGTDIESVGRGAFLSLLTEGWEQREEYDGLVLLVKEPQVNHVAHFIVSLLTAGIFLPVWLFIALTSKTQRRWVRVSQDDDHPEADVHGQRH